MRLGRVRRLFERVVRPRQVADVTRREQITPEAFEASVRRAFGYLITDFGYSYDGLECIAYDWYARFSAPPMRVTVSMEIGSSPWVVLARIELGKSGQVILHEQLDFDYLLRERKADTASKDPAFFEIPDAEVLRILDLKARQLREYGADVLRGNAAVLRATLRRLALRDRSRRGPSPRYLAKGKLVPPEMARDLSAHERNLIISFAEKLSDVERSQLLRDLSIARAMDAMQDGSFVRFHLPGYVRPKYCVQHQFAVEGRTLDADGEALELILNADENGRLLDLEILRNAGAVIAPHWNGLTIVDARALMAARPIPHAAGVLRTESPPASQD